LGGGIEGGIPRRIGWRERWRRDRLRIRRRYCVTSARPYNCGNSVLGCKGHGERKMVGEVGERTGLTAPPPLGQRRRLRTTPGLMTGRRRSPQSSWSRRRRGRGRAASSGQSQVVSEGRFIGRPGTARFRLGGRTFPYVFYDNHNGREAPCDKHNSSRSNSSETTRRSRPHHTSTSNLQPFASAT